MSIFLDVMKEELERNLYKQGAFQKELNSIPKGYISICIINGKKYVYRKRRDGDKIVSEYIGVPGDDASNKAYKERDKYLSIKESLNNLKKEEIKLRRAIKDYEKLWNWNE